ncbi:WD40 repeat-like protein [Thozetella sp. PMI_491]|nr:WD40 repeat-like protein [Thozetella sp. PMI_491]
MSPPLNAIKHVHPAGRTQRTRNVPVYNLKQLTYASRTRQPGASPVSRQGQRKSIAPAPVQTPTSQENYRTRAHALAWRKNEPSVGSQTPSSRMRSLWFSGARRPYLPLAARKNLAQRARQLLGAESLWEESHVVHVDFAQDEVDCVRELAGRILGLPATSTRLFKKQNRLRIARELPAVAKREEKLRSRTAEDIECFLADLVHTTTPHPQVLSLASDDYDHQGAFSRASRAHSLLFAREVGGSSRWAYLRSALNFTHEFRRWREDELELRTEWTNCAGDISTIAWVSNNAFICGTTEHSDSHNQQYNKPGNLVLGSCLLDKLRAYPDHRVVRPIVEKGENATAAMRESQDPWLYSSVVSSDYDATHDRAFTSGFDRTVKVWKVKKDGSSMELLGEWEHSGNVNFVAASKHPSGMVASAADVHTAAVRIYSVDSNNVSGSPFRTFSCSRITDLEGNVLLTEKWAYFPATMQWGICPEVNALLLVGYSPRSRTGDDSDIPEDRRDSGELCLWDAISGERWKVTSVNRQNIFEVAWHPSQPCFAAATAPAGLDVGDGIRTQIRIFWLFENISIDGQDVGRGFSAIKTLDCLAMDINELTIMPNSYTYCYVTAGCTDGNVYVWDTAREDKPIHVLRHGRPVEEFNGDREREDTGVKFTAWGTTLDRFYTGSSDGVVKVWNVQSLGKPLVRDLLELPAPVSYGMFAPSKSKLVIGDASGRVFLLSLDEPEQKPASFVTLPEIQKAIRRPKPLIPHPEPPAPEFDANGVPVDPESGPKLGHTLLQREILRLPRRPDPTIGVVQGPNYPLLGLYDKKAHVGEDGNNPLVASEERQQQEILKRYRQHANPNRPLRAVRPSSGLLALHRQNMDRDLDCSLLSEELKHELRLAGAELGDQDYGLDYEESPSEDEFYGG